MNYDKLSYYIVRQYLQENGAITIKATHGGPTTCIYFIKNNKIHWQNLDVINSTHTNIMNKTDYDEFVKSSSNNVWHLEKMIRKQLPIHQRIFYEL